MCILLTVIQYKISSPQKQRRNIQDKILPLFVTHTPKSVGISEGGGERKKRLDIRKLYTRKLDASRMLGMPSDTGKYHSMNQFQE